MMCSPRPVSAREPGVWGAGAALLGSATAHSTPGPGCSRPSPIGRRGQVSPDPGRACRNALVSSSDTTIAMSWLRSAVPQRCKVAMVKSRAARTDPASAPRVRIAIRGMRSRPAGTGSGGGRQLTLAKPAISAASISQRLPGPARPVSLVAAGGERTSTCVLPLTGEGIPGVFLDHQDPHLCSPASRMPSGGRASSPRRPQPAPCGERNADRRSARQPTDGHGVSRRAVARVRSPCPAAIRAALAMAV